MRIHTPSSTQQSGFSLVHVVLVVTVVSMMACAAILSWFGRSDITLDKAINLLASDLNHVQSRAAYEERDLKVIFMADGTGYEVRTLDGQSVPAPIGPGPFSRAYDRGAIFGGVRVKAVEMEGAREIVFTPLGPAPPYGTITLEFKGEQRSLRIIDGSGRIALLTP